MTETPPPNEDIDKSIEAVNEGANNLRIMDAAAIVAELAHKKVRTGVIYSHSFVGPRTIEARLTSNETSPGEQKILGYFEDPDTIRDTLSATNHESPEDLHLYLGIPMHSPHSEEVFCIIVNNEVWVGTAIAIPILQKIYFKADKDHMTVIKIPPMNRRDNPGQTQWDELKIAISELIEGGKEKLKNEDISPIKDAREELRNVLVVQLRKTQGTKPK